MVTLERTELSSSESSAMLMLVLVADRAAPGRARRQVTIELEEWRMEHLCETVILVTSEMITNAYNAIAEATPHGMRASHGIKFVMIPDEDGLRLEVTDPIPTPDPASAPALVATCADDDAESGRGLYLIEMLSLSWGVRKAPGGGKTVWARIGAMAT
jgi:hypothetical protein